MTKAKITKETYIQWYTEMLRMRRFEEKAGQLYGQQRIRGFCHLYIGQEAVAAGMISAAKKDDIFITAYRDHGYGIALGMTMNECMAELFGKATGSSKGKGGSMHFFKKEKGFAGGHGIVGGQIGLGAGLAFAEKYKGTKNVVYCMFGDGAARQGILHETFNMAMTWKLPVVFVCENNMYAMGTSVERTSNVTDIYTIGEAYDMPSAPVDGMDMIDVHSKTAKAAQHCRTGKGPYFLEMKTYRYKGHSMSDPQKYRTKEELASYKDQDPIDDALEVIKKKKYLTDKQIQKIKDDVKAEVKACVEFAENSPYPEDSEIYNDVYVEPNYPFLD